jgi:hypothetical protein
VLFARRLRLPCFTSDCKGEAKAVCLCHVWVHFSMDQRHRERLTCCTRATAGCQCTTCAPQMSGMSPATVRKLVGTAADLGLAGAAVGVLRRAGSEAWAGGRLGPALRWLAAAAAAGGSAGSGQDVARLAAALRPLEDAVASELVRGGLSAQYEVRCRARVVTVRVRVRC